MLASLGIVLGLGFLGGFLLNKIKIPRLVGMVCVGMIIGPYCLSLIDSSLLQISTELRQIALVIILTRSGLNLDFDSLKKVGRPAILMCFLPASLEIIGVGLSSHFLLKLTISESLLLGSVLAAVSPAVVSPRMISLIEEGYGEEHNVPELILAGSSVDDVFVIVAFYAFLGLTQGSGVTWTTFAMIPVSLILGIGLGIFGGIGLVVIFKKVSVSNTISILLFLVISFLFIGLENWLKQWISISGLLGIMVMGIVVMYKDKPKAQSLSNGYNQMWLVFEIILFVLVGASLDITSINESIGYAILVLCIGLCFRSFGVFLCLVKTNLNWKERVFTILSYLPKATVQASIGGIALSMGLNCGNIVLMVAVLSILITAPIGAIAIDNLGRRLLKKQEE